MHQVGPIGGFQIGYNWQFSPLFVLGLEADIQGADITSDRDAGNTTTATQSFAGTGGFTKAVVGGNSAEALVASFTNPAITTNSFNSVTADLNWLGTVRARLGYLITPNLLLYATNSLSQSVAITPNNFTATQACNGAGSSCSLLISERPPTTVGVFTGSAPGLSQTGYAQTTKPLSVAR